MFEIILIFFKSFFAVLSNPLVLTLLIIFIITSIIKLTLFKRTSYYTITHTPYLSMIFDSGKLGEYLIYKHLKNYEKNGCKFLFNIYVPKEDSITTEIDVLLISPKGIFVFESKNYSGWIFGKEQQKNWTQVLPKGRGRSHKEHFYNPIMQNNSHIKHLKNMIGGDIPMHSVITFSERCTLKDITLTNDNIKVINRYDVAATVTKICSKISSELLTQAQIDDIYNKLFPYTQTSDEVKEKHIANIKATTVPTQAVTKETLITETSDAKTDIIETTASGPTSDTTDVEPPLKCPKCGGDLVLRTAKRGKNQGEEFYGCSNFPKCRYIQ